MHALWLLFLVAAALAPVSASSNASLTRVLTTENLRTRQDPYLATALNHPSASVRQAAIFAIARIGDASLLGDLSALLNKRKGTNKNDVAFALGLIPDETAVTIAVQHLAMQQDPEMLADLFIAIGRGGSEKNLTVFSEGLRKQGNPKVLRGVCLGLGSLWAKESENWAVPPGIHSALLQRASTSDELCVACGFALSRFKGLGTHIPPAELLKVAETSKSKEGLVFLIKTLSKVQTPAAASFLIQKAFPFTNQAARVEALKAMAAFPVAKNLLSSLRTALDSDRSHVVYEALETLQGYGQNAKEVSVPLLGLYKKSPSAWLKGKMIKAGVAMDPPLWKPVALKEITDPKSLLRASAAGALALTPDLGQAPLIATLLKEPNTKVPLELLESLGAWPEDAFTEEIKVSLRSLLEKRDPAVVASVAGLVERFKWTEFGSALAMVFPSFSKPDLVETKIALITAMGSLGDTTLLPLIETALKDSERLVALAASDVLREATKKDFSALVPFSSKAFPFVFSASEVTQSERARVGFRTNRGEILFRMLKEAPLSAVHFLRLVRKHFYDGLTFHRVVPGFVIQGGDPRGDGFGGPGYLVRDEVSPHPHLRGTVGLATSGKDTGGSQFFINLAPNLHLDGKYTVFAEVTQGMEVVDRIEVGDKILSTRVLP
jgi:cyclophilin family peptidyl-prolyl cis-trans isomerase/HEAT repeat protein